MYNKRQNPLQAFIDIIKQKLWVIFNKKKKKFYFKQFYVFLVVLNGRLVILRIFVPLQHHVLLLHQRKNSQYWNYFSRKQAHNNTR